MRVKVQEVYEPPDIDVYTLPEYHGMVEILKGIYDHALVKEDIYYLHKECRIPIKTIAKRLGIHKYYLYRWTKPQGQRGISTPLNPLPLIGIRIWAKKLREYREAQSSKPYFNHLS